MRSIVKFVFLAGLVGAPTACEDDDLGFTGAFDLTIVETDGFPVPPGAQLIKDTVNVGPGERYDVIWTADLPGKWLLHCHIPHHTTNDNHEMGGGGGLTTIIDVTA